MKTPLLSRLRIGGVARSLLSAAGLMQLLSLPLHGDEPVPPLLQFTSGLSGKQVRLTWPSTPGAGYLIEKSADLGSGGGGGAGGWVRVALVDSGGATTQWIDPETTTTRSFYRVYAPTTPEVFSVSPPVLSVSGGVLEIRGRSIPENSYLSFNIPGQAPILLLLTAVPGQPGVWQATLAADSVGGIAGGVVAGIVVSADGATICPVPQKFQITATNFSLDGPASLPPAAPLPQAASNPIPGVGIVVKRNPGSSTARAAGGVDDDCDGLDDSASLIAIWGSKKGYDYYQAQSALNKTGLQNNPAFQENKLQGTMQRGGYTNPAFQSNNNQGTMASRMKAKEKANRTKCANNLRSSGVIGEVSLEFSPLSVECPAGPNLECALTYRSMVASGSSSSFGTGWTGSCDVSVSPIPANSGAAAEQVLVRDGGGRTDVYVRQADGTFTCDGMFRTGSFSGNTFTLTFPDQGKWTFASADGSTNQWPLLAITDRNGVALTCSYSQEGLLASVSSAFGQSLTFTRGPTGQITRVTDHTGRFCDFSYSDGVLAACSSPQEDGQPPSAGPTTFTYTSGFKDPRRNANLLSCRDGAGRLLCAFTYADQADSMAVDYDCVVTRRCSDSPAVPSATNTYTELAGGVLVSDCDELGRLTEITCDRQHRPIMMREYTGFSVAATPVTPSSNRPSGKLRASDPDFYQTTCTFNSQHCPTVLTEPDGLQTRCTYEADLLGAGCPVGARGNLRICTLRAPGGEERTVSMTYLPGFGSPEPACSIKAGHYAVSNFTGDSSVGLPKITPKIAKESHGKFRTATSAPATGDSLKYIGGGGKAQGVMGQKAKAWMVNNFEVHPVSAGFLSKKGYDYYQARTYVAGRFSLDVEGKKSAMDDWESPLAILKKEEGGRHTPFHNKSVQGFITSLTTTLGQKFTNSYDSAGNCIATRTPISGAGCDMTYNSLGQLTTVVTLNGPGSSFTDEFTYDPATKFCSSAVRDPAGLHLTESCTRDSLGRVTSVTDARGYDTRFAYNALDLCVSVQSPQVGSSRITTTCSYDAGGLLSRCDVEQRDATGALSATNPHYSSVCIRDSATCPFSVSHVAVENRPVDLPAGADPASVGIENFDVCDFTFDACGQLLETRTPAACLAQPVDQVCSYQYDERGLLHRSIDGGLGTVGAVTTQCDYTPARDLSRCVTVGPSPAESPTVTCDYDGFRRCISSTDPMGNVETFSYDNRGSVTCSLFGELDDVAGSTDNVLLATARTHTAVMGIACTSGANDRMAYNKHPDLMKRCANPFFDVCIEDDITTVERFTPGSAAPPVLETTTCDNSPAGLFQGISTNGDSLLTCSYDSAGRNYLCSNATCSDSLTLDAGGNVLSAVRTDFSSTGGPSKSFTTSHVFDPLGRCIQVTEGGNSTTCDFDSLGREIRRINPNGVEMFRDYDAGTQASPYSVRTRCDVDGDGNLEILGSSYSRGKFWMMSTHAQRSVTDSNGSTTTFTCDSQGRCVRTDFPDGTRESSSFDILGHETSHVRKNGAVVAADYDYKAQSRTITVTDPNPSVSPITTVYHYDGLGNVVRTTQGSSDIVCTFDSCCDLVSENQNGRIVSHTYNHRGRSSTTYPDGSRFNEVRDSQGRLISCAAEGGPPIVAFEYLGSRVAKDTRLNGVVITFTYRGDGDSPIQGSGDLSFDACVQSIVTGPGSVLSRDTFSRNRSQHLTRRETAFNSEPSTLAPLRRQIYTLDRLNRVTRMQTGARTTSGSATVSESDVSYTLDLEGKRLTATGGANPGSYTSSSSIPPGDLQMKQYTTWPGGELQWDDNGCLVVHAHGTGGSFRYRYDALSRMVGVEDNGTGATLVSFGYDACDRLISRTLPSGGGLPPATTAFVYDGEMCIQELGGDGLPDMTFAALGHCISTRNGTIYYPHGGGSLATSPGGGMPHVKLLTLANGVPFERFDGDDGCKPVFLTSEGVVRQGANRALSNYDWIQPSWDKRSIWSPQSNFFLNSDGVYVPDLGQQVSKPKPKSTKPLLTSWNLATGKK